MHLKKLATLITCALLAFFACAGSTQAAITNFFIATGGTTGTYFPIGSAIAQAAGKGGGMRVIAETSNASVASLNLLGNMEVDFALAQNDTAFWAYNGRRMFKAPLKNLRAIAVLYPEHIQIVVTAESKITDIAGMKGKRISVGAPDSGTETAARAIFELGKLAYADCKIDYLDYAATAGRFKEGRLDAGFIVAGYPTAVIMDMAASKGISLVSFSDAFLADLAKKHPYFVPSVIPANTYHGTDKATKTPAVMAMLLTHSRISDELVYSFVKNMFANLDAIHASHVMAKQITLDGALKGLTVPLHPGALRFYREKNLKIPNIK